MATYTFLINFVGRMKILADINTRKNDILIFLCFLIAAALLSWAAYAAWINFRTTPPYVDRNQYPIGGFDISAHNGDIDFKSTVKDGMEFVWIKATEGVTFRDRKFMDNHEQAGQAGLKRGAYHFFRFDKDGVEQAINLLETVGERILELGVAIDIESSGNPEGIDDEVINERIVAMIDYLNLRGVAPTLYCNKTDYYKYLSESFPGNSLWICSFSQDPIAAPWTFWQFNHKGSLKGANGKVDLNVFGGNREEWINFISTQQYKGNKSVN